MKRLTECHDKFIVETKITVLTSGVVVSLLGHVVVDAELGLGDDEFLLGVREHNSLVIENRFNLLFREQFSIGKCRATLELQNCGFQLRRSKMTQMMFLLCITPNLYDKVGWKLK